MPACGAPAHPKNVAQSQWYPTLKSDPFSDTKTGSVFRHRMVPFSDTKTVPFSDPAIGIYSRAIKKRGSFSDLKKQGRLSMILRPSFRAAEARPPTLKTTPPTYDFATGVGGRGGSTRPHDHPSARAQTPTQHTSCVHQPPTWTACAAESPPHRSRHRRSA